MWTFPNCHQKFHNKNQSHSCGEFSPERLLAGKSAHAIALFNSFIEKYRDIGRFELHPVKTRVTLLVKMRFAAVNRLGRGFLNGHLVLAHRAIDHTGVFYRIDNLNDRFFVHHFRLTTLSDIEPLLPFMKQAYEVGLRRHIVNRR